MDKKQVEIHSETDIVLARRLARTMAESLGFSVMGKTRIATAVSELARNVYQHGGGGSMLLETINQQNRLGLQCVFIDQGPGIADITMAMMDGYSTGNTLGHGLPGSKRLVDEFEIHSEVGKGTQVKIVKWK